MRRSTFYEEDLGKVVDLCGHGTWDNADLCEIIQELVDALSPLQTVSKGHEERFVALEAVQKTAQEQASGETQRTTEQTREFTESLFENASQESGHQVPGSAERPRRINASVLGHDQPEWLAALLGRLQVIKASIAALSGAAYLRPAVAVTDPLTEVVRRRSDLQFTRKPSTAGLDCFRILGVVLKVRVDGPCQDASEGFGFQEGSEVVAQLNCQSASYAYFCDFRCVAQVYDHSTLPIPLCRS